MAVTTDSVSTKKATTLPVREEKEEAQEVRITLDNEEDSEKYIEFFTHEMNRIAGIAGPDYQKVEDKIYEFIHIIIKQDRSQTKDLLALIVELYNEIMVSAMIKNKMRKIFDDFSNLEEVTPIMDTAQFRKSYLEIFNTPLGATELAQITNAEACRLFKKLPIRDFHQLLIRLQDAFILKCEVSADYCCRNPEIFKELNEDKQILASQISYFIVLAIRGITISLDHTAKEMRYTITGTPKEPVINHATEIIPTFLEFLAEILNNSREDVVDRSVTPISLIRTRDSLTKKLSDPTTTVPTSPASYAKTLFASEFDWDPRASYRPLSNPSNAAEVVLVTPRFPRFTKALTCHTTESAAVLWQTLPIREALCIGRGATSATQDISALYNLYGFVQYRSVWIEAPLGLLAALTASYVISNPEQDTLLRVLRTTADGIVTFKCLLGISIETLLSLDPKANPSNLEFWGKDALFAELTSAFYILWGLYSPLSKATHFPKETRWGTFRKCIDTATQTLYYSAVLQVASSTFFKFRNVTEDPNTLNYLLIPVLPAILIALSQNFFSSYKERINLLMAYLPASIFAYNIIDTMHREWNEELEPSHAPYIRIGFYSASLLASTALLAYKKLKFCALYQDPHDKAAQIIAKRKTVQFERDGSIVRSELHDHPGAIVLSPQEYKKLEDGFKGSRTTEDQMQLWKHYKKGQNSLQALAMPITPPEEDETPKSFWQRCCCRRKKR